MRRSPRSHSLMTLSTAAIGLALIASLLAPAVALAKDHSAAHKIAVEGPPGFKSTAPARQRTVPIPDTFLGVQRPPDLSTHGHLMDSLFDKATIILALYFV